jgi:hypothetical protein
MRPELVTAVVNGLLVMSAPLMVRVGPVPVLIGLIVAWRTWAHARRVQRDQGSGWQGVLEGGVCGLILTLWVIRNGLLAQPLETLPYIVLTFGGGGAVVGVLLGFVLFLTARFTLRLVSRAE